MPAAASGDRLLFVDADTLPSFRLFAAAGSNRATVFECLEDGTTEVLQVYVDEDLEEIFFAVAWSVDEATGQLLLAIAGFRGVIKILSVSTQELVACLLGQQEDR